MLTPEDLADAPLLDDYYIYPHGNAAVLVGKVSGHPTLLDGPITTSKVIAVNEQEGWAETLNRTYRLGRPFEKKKSFLDELIASGPFVVPTYDPEAVMRANEEDPDLPPWRP
jgi:hypothetical protein